MHIALDKKKGYNEFNFSSMVAKKSKLKHVKYLRLRSISKIWKK